MMSTEARRLFKLFIQGSVDGAAYARRVEHDLAPRARHALPKNDKGVSVPLVVQNDKATSVMLITGEHRILFSYGVCVAFHVRDTHEVFYTTKEHSRTTNNHIATWIKWLVTAGYLDTVTASRTLPQQDIEEVLR